MNLAAFLARSAAVFPEDVAVVCGSQALTWASLDAAANRFANGLRARGIGRGDRVVLACPNLPAFVIAYYGVLKLGAILVPINILLKAGEIAYHLRDSGARALVCFEGSAELPLGVEGRAAFAHVPECTLFVAIGRGEAGEDTMESVSQGQPPSFDTVDCAPGDTAVILYTSGTTGTPKGAELSHSNLCMNALASVAMTHLDAHAVSLIALPLFHSFGQSVQMNASVASGGSMILLTRFEPEAAMRAMTDHSVTVFCGVPTMYIALLNHDWKGPDLAATLRVGVSGGAAMPVAVLRDFEKRYGVVILEGYGLSETSPVATFNHFDTKRVPGSVGVALAGTEVGIMDEAGRLLGTDEPGEIVVRGHNVMKGYWNKPEATAEVMTEDGFFRTGDVGYMDQDGYVYIVDRTKDMILCSGYNVYPRVVEEAIYEHPSVSEVSVIGVRDEYRGQSPKAFVTLKKGASAFTLEELQAFLQSRLGRHEMVQALELRTELPKTPVGKLSKKELYAEEEQKRGAR
jgi:long-chain acyl-CoA synthetase